MLRARGPNAVAHLPTRMTRLQKLQGHADQLLSSFIGLRMNYGLLKPILGDPSAGVPHPPPRVHYRGISALRNILFRSCVLDLVKLAWDTDHRTPSVSGLMTALQDQDVIRSVIEFHSTPRLSDEGASERELRHRARIAESNADVRRSQVRQQLDDLDALWSQFDGASIKQHFITMRDKHIAHLEVRLEGTTYAPLDVTTLEVRRRDLDTAVTAMERLVWLPTAILRDSDFAMDRTAEMFDSDGEQLWRARA